MSDLTRDMHKLRDQLISRIGVIKQYGHIQFNSYWSTASISLRQEVLKVSGGIFIVALCTCDRANCATWV